jgi:hypothetical protein
LDGNNPSWLATIPPGVIYGVVALMSLITAWLVKSQAGHWCPWCFFLLPSEVEISCKLVDSWPFYII